MFIASQVPVQLYFHEKRALASSLAVLGSGLGKCVTLNLSSLLTRLQATAET